MILANKEPSPSMGEGWEGVTLPSLLGNRLSSGTFTPTPSLPHRGGGGTRGSYA